MFEFIIYLATLLLGWLGYELRPVEKKYKNSSWMRADYEVKKQNLLKVFAAKNSEGNLALSKKTTNLFRFRQQPKNTTRLDVSQFNNVIDVNTEDLYVEVEGMTTYERLVDETLRYNVMPTVVPELKSITIGGAISGIGVESSSFKFGFVHETVIEMEILLCNGTVVVCNREQNSDLFFGMANSYGTLGYVLKVKVKVVPVKPYVQLRHVRFGNMKEYFEAIDSYCSPTMRPDFIDGAIFSPKEMYVTLATFVDTLPESVSGPTDYTWMNIYYRSLQKKTVDYVTTKMYIWRWDYDWFWNSKYFHMQNPILRFLLGRWLLRSTIFMKVFRSFHKSGLYDHKRRELVIQDVEIPIQNCVAFMDFFNKEVGLPNDFYPVWVCPVKSYDPKVEYPLYKMNSNQLYINFGFWDGVAVRDNQPGLVNKMIENTVRDLKGKKSLYSSGHYDENTFWQEYNRVDYDKLREKYKVTSYLNLYQKCVGGK